MLFYPWLDNWEVEEADKMQAACESAAVKRGERRNYSGVLAAQCHGPLTKFLIPIDHNRNSHSKLVQNMLYDEDATRCIDFDALEHLVCTTPSEAEDEVTIALNPILA